jgi:hypothetical protein
MPDNIAEFTKAILLATSDFLSSIANATPEEFDSVSREYHNEIKDIVEHFGA